MIKAVVGSGGKTTLIRRLARQYRQQGRKVFVTTTTRMYREPDTLLAPDAGTILRALEETGYAMAGTPMGEKIGPLPEEVYLQVCKYADVVLVEADGSRHFPLKFPAPYEPVIPANAEEIILVWGSHGLGRPLTEVCHRPELARACLQISDDTPVTMAHVQTLLQEGYLKPLKKKYPHIPISVHQGP